MSKNRPNLRCPKISTVKTKHFNDIIMLDLKINIDGQHHILWVIDVDLLKSRHGAQILSNKDLRAYIFANLTDAYIKFLIDGNFNETVKAERSDREKLIKTSWNRNTKSIQYRSFSF